MISKERIYILYMLYDIDERQTASPLPRQAVFSRICWIQSSHPQGTLYILHSYKCQPFFLSLPACLSRSQTVCCVSASLTSCPAPVARASHARTLINVNPFFVSLHACLPASCLRSISSVRIELYETLLVASRQIGRASCSD